MHDKERDLGFFNGIKAELLPLIAGLVSFTLLVEKTVNHISDFFSLETKNSTIIFVMVYFIVPAIALLFWITIFNYRSGIKALVLKKPHRVESILLLIVIVTTIILCSFFIFKDSFQYLIVCLALILLSLTLFLIFLFKGHGRIRELSQARWQLGIVFILLLTFWGFYFSNNFFKDKGRFCLENICVGAMSETLFGGAFNNAVNSRKHFKQLDSSANHFYRDYIQYINSGIKKDSILCISLTQQFNKLISESTIPKPKVDSCKCRVIEKKYRTKDGIDKRIKLSIVPVDYFAVHNSEFIRYHIDQKLKTEDEQYRSYWSSWLRVVQFKGLILFMILILFFMLVWYYAYTEWLNNDMRGGFSEINISKISIYILFLLTIPFFKPITKDSMVFDKPYVSLNTSTLNTFNNSGTVNRDSIDWSQMPNIYEAQLEALDAKLIKIDTVASSIDRDIKKLKEKPKKEGKAYDE